jgi:hypothetical protein
VRRPLADPRVPGSHRSHHPSREHLRFPDGRPAVSVRLFEGAPVALVDHARAERPGLD